MIAKGQKRFSKFLIALFSIFVMVGVSDAENSFSFTSDRVMLAVPIDSGGFFYADLVNTGDETDTYTITKHNDIPESWFAVFCVDSLCLWDSVDVELEPGVNSSVRPELFSLANPGDGEVTIRIRSHNNPDDIKEIAFRMVTGYSALLICKDTSEAGYRSYYDDALSSAGIAYNFWDSNFATFLDIDLINFEKILIYSGDAISEIFSTDELEAMESYLNVGGNAILTGQGLASSLQDVYFIENVLGLTFVETYNDRLEIIGSDNSPIGSGLDFPISGGEGADNQFEPDIIEPINGTIIFEYPDGGAAAISNVNTNYKSLFFGFGLEAVADANIRAEIISRSIEWLDQATEIGDNTIEFPNLPDQYNILKNYPNPFNGGTSIFIHNTDFDIYHEKSFIEIFDINGRFIKKIAMTNANNAVFWDGDDMSGNQVSSGVYFYRLQSPRYRSDVGRMILIK